MGEFPIPIVAHVIERTEETKAPWASMLPESCAVVKNLVPHPLTTKRAGSQKVKRTTETQRGKAGVRRLENRCPENRKDSDRNSPPNSGAPMKTFLQRFALVVSGVLSGFDRVVFKGRLRQLYSPEGINCYATANHVRYLDFKKHAKEVTRQVMAASLVESAKAAGSRDTDFQASHGGFAALCLRGSFPLTKISSPDRRILPALRQARPAFECGNGIGINAASARPPAARPGHNGTELGEGLCGPGHGLWRGFWRVPAPCTRRPATPPAAATDNHLNQWELKMRSVESLAGPAPAPK